VPVTTLVEARLPETDIRRTTDPLIQQLLRSKMCQPYLMPDADGEGWTSGGLAVTTSPYRLVAADGRPHPRIFAYGVPTEGVHWATAAGARPGVNSVMLCDADALAREVLSLPAPGSPARVPAAAGAEPAAGHAAAGAR